MNEKISIPKIVNVRFKNIVELPKPELKSSEAVVDMLQSALSRSREESYDMIVIVMSDSKDDFKTSLFVTEMTHYQILNLLELAKMRAFTGA